ncbi:MAG: DUF2971 domain-containing protein [Rhizobium sp.]|nr:DUF2971 domain-containing protein [Rhizobium sp.]
MRNVGTYFEMPAPFNLFHYTGIGSLIGMARSKSIWASNAYYLNDSREVIHACDILTKTIEIRIAADSADPSEIDFLIQLKSWAQSFKKTHYGIFIFSLSEKSSLLSQWRSYTPHGKGVSVGFSPELLSKLAQSSRSVLAKCIYDASEQRDVIEGLIDLILKTFRNEQSSIDLSRNHPSERYFSFLEVYREDFLRVLCLIKHSAFSEEAEWRIISPYFAGNEAKQIRFREGASMLVPYIEIPLPEIRQPFAEIVLGPSQYQNLSMSALSKYSQTENLTSLVRNCGIPFRKW